MQRHSWLKSRSIFFFKKISRHTITIFHLDSKTLEFEIVRPSFSSRRVMMMIWNIRVDKNLTIDLTCVVQVSDALGNPKLIFWVLELN